MIPAFFILAWGLGVAGIVTAIVAERKAKTLGGVRKTMARWGGLLSICAFILGCVGAAIVDNAVNELGKAGSEMQSYSDCLDQAVETGDPLEDCSMAAATDFKVNIVERPRARHPGRAGDRPRDRLRHRSGGRAVPRPPHAQTSSTPSRASSPPGRGRFASSNAGP